jgi:uncharacterized protein (TIGR03067 family)
MTRNLLGMAALLCLTALQVLAADDKKADDKSDKDKLQGTWVLTSIEFKDMIVDAPKDKESTFTFKDDKITMKEGKTPKTEGTYKLDEKKNPKEIDVTAPKEDNPKEMETVKAVYTLDGDTLKLCMPNNGPAGPRPKSLDKDMGIMVLKRKK